MHQIGRHIIRLESVDSTNNYTANRAKLNDLPHGAVILAVEQTQGRGQMGTEWLAEPGANLTFSVFLDNVNLSVERQFILTKIVSLALTDFLADSGVTATIKWPNDIYVGDRKICGVLIENSLQGMTIKRSIIGIGLNTNQKQFGNLEATSLILETRQFRSNDDVLFSFIRRLNERFDQEAKPSILDTDYLNRLRWLREERTFEDAQGMFQGVLLGVNESGKLIVSKENEETNYGLKEIKFIR